MYHKNDVKIEECTRGDAKEADGYDETYKYNNKPVAQLPHSCDEWIIGGKEEVEQFILDLQEISKSL